MNFFRFYRFKKEWFPRKTIDGNTVLIYWVQIIFFVQFLKVVDFKNRQKIRLYKSTYTENIIQVL